MTQGYDPDFIPGEHIPLPTLGPATVQSAFNQGEVIDHTRFSLVFNKDRGFAIYTAHNIDGATLFPEGTIPRRDDFRTDDNVPEELQTDNLRGYKGTHNPWDRGHLVRRSSLHWGDIEDARQGDNESFVWTNIAPQHTRLHSSAWGKIERWMVSRADEHDQKTCIYTGPVFSADDPEHQNFPDQLPIRIPSGFWKILTIKHNDTLKSAGFLVWQRDYDKVNPVSFDPHLEQVRITTLEYIAGISFGNLRDLDPLRFPESGTRSPAGEPALERVSQPPRTPTSASPLVESSNDIVL